MYIHTHIHMHMYIYTHTHIKEKSTYLLVHFNVQAIGHLIVLKVKRTTINKQKSLHFPKSAFGKVLVKSYFPDTFLLKKFKSNPKANNKVV